MRAVVARLFLLLPGWWYFFLGLDSGLKNWTVRGMLVASVLWYSFLCWWDSTRRPPRCPISVMISRLFVAFWAVSFDVLWMLPIHMPAFRYSPVLAVILLTKWLCLMLLCHAFGHFVVYWRDLNGNYYAVRRAGWHPFWDRLWPIFNPDSELIRDGGIEEPADTDFVPPPDWKFQCPVCGARQPYEICVCWNCGYGADGDSTAYYERWGDVDPP